MKPAHELTPLQYHAQQLAAMSDSTGKPLSVICKHYDTEAQKREHARQWAVAVVSAAREGKKLSRIVCDRLSIAAPTAIMDILTTCPEGVIPSGYVMPQYRKGA